MSGILHGISRKGEGLSFTFAVKIKRYSWVKER
jgi:hypothetical protein